MADIPIEKPSVPILDRITQPAKIYATLARDFLAPYTIYRWIGTGFLFLIYFIRVLIVQGWYIVTYALGLYLLNLAVGFLMPALDPDEGIDTLPTKADDEYRPFMRKLPEFRFWKNTTIAVTISLFCTFFAIFNIPVYWPILLIYFLILTGVQMKGRILHMIKHRYVPFSLGKPKYPGKTSSVSSAAK